LASSAREAIWTQRFSHITLSLPFSGVAFPAFSKHGVMMAETAQGPSIQIELIKKDM